jgi:hypothetical protein
MSLADIKKQKKEGMNNEKSAMYAFMSLYDD